MNKGDFHLIDLDQKLPGHRKFLSCWAYTGPECSFVVDPGPRSTIERLIEGVKELGISRLDYILLTHIHLDHAGGVAELLHAFPRARVLCHEKGVKHILDPARLWQGSLQVLGKVAEVYQQPNPVPESSMARVSEVERTGIRVIPTPGHAAHHISFVLGDTLIAGEVIGLRCPVPAPHSEHTFLRPGTPPRFFLEKATASIDRLLALDPPPRRILFAHYGADERAVEYLKSGREQLHRWVNLLRELSRHSRDDLDGRAHRRLLEIDPLYAAFPYLEEDIQEREWFYFRQTLTGMLGYIDAQG